MTTEQKTINILFAEDDSNLSMILKDFLEMLHYKVDHAANGEECIRLFHNNKYDLILLDVMMPKKDGFTVAKEIRKQNPQIPIIFLTAKNRKEDRIKGFKEGCDDYITKPFSTDELNLRIQAILRRCMFGNNTGQPETHLYSLGKFTFDAKNMLLISEEGKRTLTRKESALLELLCKNKNNLLPREVALEVVWGKNDYFIGRSMDVFITKLRKYLKPDPALSITNVHGIGFKLEIKEEDE